MHMVDRAWPCASMLRRVLPEQLPASPAGACLGLQRWQHLPAAGQKHTPPVLESLCCPAELPGPGCPHMAPALVAPPSGSLSPLPSTELGNSVHAGPEPCCSQLSMGLVVGGGAMDGVPPAASEASLPCGPEFVHSDVARYRWSKSGVVAGPVAALGATSFSCAVISCVAP